MIIIGLCTDLLLCGPQADWSCALERKPPHSSLIKSEDMRTNSDLLLQDKKGKQE